MARKGEKVETVEGEEMKGNKLELNLENEKGTETVSSRNSNSTGVLKKSSPSKSVNFEADKRRFTTFVKVRLEIEGKKEKGVGLNEALKTLFEIMQMADPTIMWEVYSHNTPLSSGKMIRNKEGIPKSPIEVKRYAYRAKATNDGGTSWTNLRIIHDLAFKEIMEGIYEDLKEHKMGIYEQPVQHFNVSTLGWLMYVPNDIDIKLWTEFFRNELKKKGLGG